MMAYTYNPRYIGREIDIDICPQDIYTTMSKPRCLFQTNKNKIIYTKAREEGITVLFTSRSECINKPVP
jgi:hypothetical protein